MKLKRTMRVTIGSPLYRSIMMALKNESGFSLDAKAWNIVDAQRLERKDIVVIYLEEA